MTSSRTAVVTGGGSGIGRAAAIALADDGWSVVVCGRREAPLVETAKLAAGGSITAVVADVADPHSVAAMFAGLRQRWARLDFVFNNAGVNAPAALPDDCIWDDWRRVMSVNIDGVFLCAQAAFRWMRTQQPQGGRILNNGSVAAVAPRPGAIAYTTSKSALAGLTKSVDLDGRPFRIVCGQIDIGNAESDMTRSIPQGAQQADGSIVPEPVMDVSEVGRLVAHIASLPLEVNTPFVTIKASKMPLYGRG